MKTYFGKYLCCFNFGRVFQPFFFFFSVCQMQYDAADKKTDQEDPCFIYLGGN